MKEGYYYLNLHSGNLVLLLGHNKHWAHVRYISPIQLVGIFHHFDVDFFKSKFREYNP